MTSLIRRLISCSNRKSRKRRTLSRGHDGRRRLGASLETLEARNLLAALVVANASDDVDGDTSSIAALQTTPGDDGGISLREAIEATNNTSGADEISFAPSLAGETITLGGTQLEVTDDLTITGLGAAQISISGGFNSRVFEIASGITVGMSDVRIIHGVSQEGGGILNQGTLTISDSTIEGNRASSGSGIKLGGGISNLGTLTLSDSLVQGNASPRGGGIYNDGTLTISTSEILSNKLGSFVPAAGGGILNDSAGNLTITASTVGGNSAQVEGGGIFNLGAAGITNTIIENNTAGSRGGGIGNIGAAQLTVTNSTISGNAAVNGGGGIVNSTGGTLTVIGTTLSDNHVTADSINSGGGAIENRGLLTITDSTLDGNSAVRHGGGIFNDNVFAMAVASSTVTNSEIINNTAITGGGIYNGHQEELLLVATKVRENEAVIATVPTGGEGLGGGIHNGGVATMEGGEISDNFASQSGGGIFSNTELTINGSTIADNEAAEHGGGVWNAFGVLVVNDSAVVNNFAQFGGAISNGDQASITNSTISGNTTSSNGTGGGILNAGQGALEVANSTITMNWAGDSGGGIAHQSSLAATIHHTIVAGNTAGSGSAADDISDVDSLVSGVHNLIGDPNTSGSFIHGANGNIVGQDDGSGGRELLDISTALDTTLADNGGSTLTHALVPGSPALDAGDPNFDPNDLTPSLDFDQRRAPFDRVVGSAVDIGAFEAIQDAAPAGGVIVVDEFDDVVDPLDGQWSLREAIIHANSNLGDFEIQLQAGTHWLTIAGGAENASATGDLDILNNGGITITGAGAGQTIIDAGGDGGSIPELGDRVFHVHGGASLIVQGVTVTGGTATGPFPNFVGGGIFVDGGTLVVTNSALSNNTAGLGGGISNDGGTLELSATEVRQNRAGSGGGIHNRNLGNATITASTISNNTFIGDGGGIYNSGTATLTMVESTLSQNISISTVSGSRGGAIHNEQHSTVALTGSTLLENEVPRGSGGGISNTTSGIVDISHSTLSGNTAADNGGGIYNLGGVSVTITGSTLSGNEAGRGGGIYSNSSVTIADSSLSENIAILGSNTGFGGAIYSSTPDSSVAISSSTLSNNTAYRDGGAIRYFGSVTVSNSTLSGNQAHTNGGALSSLASQSSLTVTQSTITNNRADTDGDGDGVGGGLGVVDGTATLHNTIVAGNVRGDQGSDQPDDITNGVDAIFSGTYNLIGDPNSAGSLFEGSNGNILGDGSGNLLPVTSILDSNLADNGGPTFTHALAPSSPAIDAGDPGFNPPPDFDQRGPGFGRVVGSAVDIGALEVEITNLPPVLEPIGNQTAAWGDTISFTAIANDPDPSDMLTYAIEFFRDDDALDPTFAGEIGAATGEFNWTPTAADIGTHRVRVQATDDATPPLSDMADVFITVTQATLIITADHQAKVYGDTDPSLTYAASGFQLGEDDSILTGALARAPGENVGSYAINQGTLTAGSSYMIDFTGHDLEITPAPLTITADNQTKTYDGDPFIAFTVSYDGFVASEDESVIGGTLSFGGTAVGAVNAGSYPITASGLSSDNYAIAYEDGTLTIDKADAVIVVSGTTVTYDGNSHGATGTATGVNNEPLSGLDLGASFTDVPGGTANWTFSDATGNYSDDSGSVEIVIIGGVTLAEGTLWIVGTDGDDRVHLDRHGRGQIRVHTNFYLTGNHRWFPTDDIDRMIVDLLGGDDHLTTAGNVNAPMLVRGGSGDDLIHLAGGPAVVVGGSGNDHIQGGDARNVLIGGLGSNTLKAGRGGDLLLGGATDLDDDNDALFDLLELWNSNSPLDDRVDAVIDQLSVEHDPLGTNTIHGGAEHDLIFADLDDQLIGNKRRMTVV